MNSASSYIPTLTPPSGRRLTQPKPSLSTGTGVPLVRPQTSKSTSTLPRRTTATPKPSISTRVLATPQVGDRVVIENGVKGTLKFLGTIEIKEGKWAGIELDEVGAGKNAGSVNG
jgi:hypothetical protein